MKTNDVQASVTEFKETLLSVEREGVPELMKWLEKSDFFRAPASTKYHGAFEGGLVCHSINVYHRFKQLVESEKMQVSPETIILCGLLHDICKANVYVPTKKSRKTGATLPNGKPEWEDYLGYEYEDNLPYGHGEKSVYILSGFVRLSREEAFAIRWHMGGFDKSAQGGSPELSKAFSLYPSAMLLHLADMQATYLDEREE